MTDELKPNTTPTAQPGGGSDCPTTCSTTDPASDDRRLIPGGTIAGGRFRLVMFHGGPPHLQFWQAVDTERGGQVALTVVDSDGELPAGDLDEILRQTDRLKGIGTTGLARVMGVRRVDRGGLVISEWVDGSSLKEVADTNPWPIGVATSMAPLTEAAETAHRAAIALSIDHPDRLRVNAKGDVMLAFPATMPLAVPDDDLRGIGSAIYALLINRWPAQGEQPAGWTAAALDAEGQPQQPTDVDPQIPFLISVTAAGLVRSGSGIRSATTVLSLLRQATDEFDNATSSRESPPVPPPGGYAQFRNFGSRERTQAARRGVLKAFLATAAATVVILLVIFASTVSELVAGGPGETLNTDNIGLQTPSPAVEVPQSISEPGQLQPANTTIKPVRATVFSPDGVPDSPESVGSAIDGDPTTSWSTDTYRDAVPFPKFKDGVGLLLQLPQPSVLSAVTVDLDSTGTVVQIRSSQSMTPQRLAETAELTPPTPVRPGDNTIPVDNPAPVSAVLVWISTLGTTDGESRSSISEATLRAAVPPA